jgi:hypothetical protein
LTKPDAQHEPTSRRRTNHPSASATADAARLSDPEPTCRRTVGNQTVQRLLRTGQVPAGVVLARHPAVGNQAVQRLLRPQPAQAESHAAPPAAIRRQPTKTAGNTSTWTEKRKAIQTARAGKNDAEADKLTREAIAAAAAGATFPAGVAKTAPTPDEIRLDPKLGGDALAQARPKDIPADPANYWRWMFFAPSLLDGSEVQAIAITTHELVHVAQYKKIWDAFASDKSPDKPAWEDYLKPYQQRDRVHGPEELEAHVTSLAFLTRLAPDEQTTALRGLYHAYIATGAYVPPKGDTLAITTADVGPKILDFFKTADAALQDRMSKDLWWSLLDAGPDKSVWLAVLRDLKPVARKAYADPTLRPLYDDALANEGIKKGSW